MKAKKFVGEAGIKDQKLQISFRASEKENQMRSDFYKLFKESPIWGQGRRDVESQVSGDLDADAVTVEDAVLICPRAFPIRLSALCGRG